jgi:hypothetical protein
LQLQVPGIFPVCIEIGTDQCVQELRKVQNADHTSYDMGANVISFIERECRIECLQSGHWMQPYT